MIPKDELKNLNGMTASELVAELDSVVKPYKLDEAGVRALASDDFRCELAFNAGARFLIDQLLKRTGGGSP